MAGEILSSMDKTTLDKVASMSMNKEVNGSSSSLQLSSGLEIPATFPCNNVHELRNDGDWDTELKSKKVSASMGTVSSVIGKDYAKPRSNPKNNFEARKPVNLDSEVFPVSEVWAEQMSESMIPSSDVISNEVEEFLFQILGTGFQLEKTVIQEVLGKCGYDMQKSTEKLLDLSSSVLGKHDDLVELDATEVTEKRITDVHEEKRNPCAAQRKPAGKPRKDDNLQRDILQSLFSVPERSQEDQKISRKVREARRQRTMHKLVTEPPEVSSGSCKTSATDVKQIAENVEEDAEDSYDVLRQGVREHWATAKEYYRAAVEAFIKGQKERAKRLAEQAQFFSDKAREVDEKSSQKLIDTSSSKAEDNEIFLDLSGFEPRTAVSSVKDHLKFVSGNSAIKYLRIAIGTDDPKGARKRLVVKKLENESIKWTEEKNGEIMLIRVDTINPKSLSFVKKKT